MNTSEVNKFIDDLVEENRLLKHELEQTKMIAWRLMTDEFNNPLTTPLGNHKLILDKNLSPIWVEKRNK